MIVLGQICFGASEPEKLVGTLAIIGLLGVALWKMLRRWFQTPLSPDPWDDHINAELAKDEAVPLCHHCLTPHSEGEDFCPACGAAVGQYTNWLPFPQLFSIGHVLRIGTFGNFKRSPLTVFGFWLLGLAEYMIFAPLYWFMLLKNKLHKSPSDPKDNDCAKP